MDESTRWGEWRSLLHGLDPTFASLDAARDRALAVLTDADPGTRAKLAYYAEDMLPMFWSFDELVEYWEAHVVEGERIGHLRLGVHSAHAREKLLGDITCDPRHGGNMLMCEPFWLYVNSETDLIDQVLVNAPAQFATPDGVIAMGTRIESLRAHGTLTYTIDDLWILEERPRICFGVDDGDHTKHERVIEWIAVTVD